MTTEANADIATIRQRWANMSELLYHERRDDEDARYIIDARLDDEDGTLLLIDAPDSHECYALQLAADATRDVPALLAALDAATERAARICEDAANEHTSDVVRSELLMIARLIRNPEVAA